ncbi:MAG: hypothetical protein HUU35_05160 [Armatimonadetes bacterium]|nr:hypothetical protein [Armatimonadota bacterium]
MSEAMATEFVRRLMGLDFYAGMVLIDTSAKDSISTAEDATYFSNKKRQSEHHKKVKTPNLMYEVFIADAVARAWGAYCLVHRHELGMTDVVLDTKPIPPALQDEVARNLRSAFLKSAGLKVCDVRWASEEEEPLLLVPDHLAGLVRRNVMSYTKPRKECVEAWDLLEPARQSGRLQIQDGREFTTLPDRPRGGEPPPGAEARDAPPTQPPPPTRG